MSRHRHLSRRQAERIIDASARPSQTESDHAVGPVLDALRAPARGSELRHEDAMVAAFHSARLTPPTSNRSDMTTTSRKAATRAALATGVVVALSSGGFALAATGHLPTLPDQASDKATESVAKSRATTAPTTTATTTTETESESTETESTETESTETESETATPSLTGLCKAFQANDKSLHGKSLDSEAFTALATAAGGKENIATYCVTLVGEPKVKPVRPTPTNKPTTTGKPTVKPTPTNKPTVKPTPTNKPTDKPTVKPTPTDKPTPAEKGESATATS